MNDAIVSDDRRLLTLGQLSEHLNVASHRLKYAIDQHRIAPAMRVGIIRVWSESDLPQIKRALAQVAANRRGGHVHAKS